MTPVQPGVGRAQRWALVAVSLAFLLDLLDSTIVNLAIPSIRAGIGGGGAAVQWLVAGYSLAFSMLLVVGGRLGDIFGYRRMFLVGVVAFATASLGCGLAQTPGELVAARVAQGSAAALMAPQVMSLVQVMYRPYERGAVMGLFGVLGGLGASLGPVLGGLLIRADLFGLAWRPVFLINLPIAVLAVLGGVFLLPEGRSAQPLKPDVLGAGLIAGAIFLLVYPLIQGPQAHWPPYCFVMLAAAIPVFLVFLGHVRRRERAGRAPLVPLVLFKDGVFDAGMGVNVLLQVTLGGYFLVFSVALQLGLGLGVLAASLTTLPFSIGVGFGVAVMGRRLGTKLGRTLVAIGLALLAASWVLLAMTFIWIGQPSPFLLAPILLLGGGGMGMVVGPLSALALSQVDLGHAGAASGVFSAAQQLGAAFGAAGLGAVFFGSVRLGPHIAGFQTPLAATLVLAALVLAVAILLSRRLPTHLSPPAATH